METIYNIGQVLGITIIHSLWQGLILYIVLRFVFTAVPALSSVKKYNLAMVAMVAVSGWFFYTLFSEFANYNWASSKTSIAHLPVGYAQAIANQQAFANYRSTFYSRLAVYLPYVGTLYVAGLIFNIARLSWEWNKLRLIKQALIPAEQMQQYINKFSKKLNISKHIQLNFSKLVNVPCTIGYFKPIILLPVSLATYLSACEVEAILLHELSHIKRNDYLINLLQQAISVMLFFNPFAQLINRIINLERENGCDDLVVEKTGKPLIYAQALLKLEENRGPHLKLALAATGKKNYLLNRIERIMKTKQPIGNIRHLIIAALLLAGGLGSIAWFNPQITAAKGTKAKHAKTAAKVNDASMEPTLFAFAAANDSNKFIRVSDTTKHHKAKIIIIDSAGNKKEYDPADANQSDSLISDVKKKFNFNFSNDNRFWNDSLQKFFSGADWKKQMEFMQKQGEEMSKTFNSQAWKNQMQAMTKQGDWMKKHFDSPEWKAQMKKQGELMKKQFDSPEWKEQMQKQAEMFKKQFDNPQWKEQMEKQGELMKKQFDSPEWKEQMQKQAETFKKQFDNPQWKEQMEKQGELMKKQFDSPQWKKQMQEWKFNFDDSTKWDDQDTVVIKHKVKAAKKVIKKQH